MSLRTAELPRTALVEAAGLLGRACRFDRAAGVAEEKLLGASPQGRGVALGAFDGARLLGVAALAGKWLRLLAVEPEATRQGVGTALLRHAEALVRAAGGRGVRTADEPGNYLTPGVDARDGETLGWLERRGFSRVGENESWKVRLAENPLVSPARAVALAAQAEARGYVIERAGAADAGRLSAWVGEHFGAAWAFEVERALESDPPAVHVARARADGPLAAFAAHDGNNRGLGAFGPAGTVPAHRGLGLGLALLVRCLADVAAAGHLESAIPWIGPRDYYQRAVGAVPDRRFVVLERPV
ncbi:MAG: GNAT family N-acetyltransferase [Candidatus Rokuibacteriota bacterium]